MSKKTKGICFIIGSAFFFACMNMFVKMAGQLPVEQKAFFRNLFAVFFAALVMLRKKEKPDIRKDNIWPLIGRSAVGTLGIFCNYYAIDHMITADASILNKLSPFFTVVLSVFILKEKVKFKQLVCVCMALFGAAFVVKPSAEIVSNPATLVGLLGGFAAGLAMTFVRVCSQRNTPSSTVVIFFSVFSCLVFLPMFITHPAPMSAGQILCMVMAGLSGAFGQFFITAAYSRAPARDISVYDYSMIIFSTVLGVLFLGELPDYLSFIGYGIIVTAGILMFLMNKEKA